MGVVMALPVGVTTATCTVGVPVSFTGAANIRATVSVKPSVFLVHAATGTPLVDMLESIDTTDGVAGQFVLPHTDQAGFVDENQNQYTNWYYTVTIQYANNFHTMPPKTKVFQLTSGQTLVDLDRIPSGGPALPYSAPAAVVSSVVGLTGPVTGAQIAADPAITATYAGLGSDASVPYAGIIPGSFTKWRAALAKVRAGSASAKLLCVGDSTTWGIGSGAANIPDGSYPAQLSKLINSYLAPTAPGLVVPTSYLESPSVDTRWGIGAGWTEGALAWGNGSDYAAPNGTATALTFTPGINCDTFDVYYLTAESGRVNLSVDGGATTQTAAPAGQGVDKTTITATAGTGHVLTINNVTGGTAHIIGVDAYLSTDRAVRVGNAGVAGSTTFGWKGDYPAINFSAPSCIAKYAPDLTIIMLGINDAGAGYAAAGVKANQQLIIDAAKASGDVIMASVVPSGPGIAGINTLEQAYRLDQIDLAKTNNIGFVDVYARYGSWATADATGLMAEDYPTNDLHPGPNGYADIAAAMFAAIRAIG